MVRSSIAAVEEFTAAAACVPSLAALDMLLADVVARLGFDYYAVGYHIVPVGEAPAAVGLTNYPVSWRGELRPGLAHDPVVRAAERRAAGFAWDELASIIDLTAHEKARLNRAARHGLVNGFTVPVHVPGEALGSSSFAVKGDRALPRRNFIAAQALGTFAFEAMRGLLSREPGGRLASPAPDAEPLTRRQRECLALVARGKSDSVIADILGIRPHTVTEHIEAARRRYAVATRSQLLVRALLAGDLTYGEIA
ncbi:MAG TPA: LuxR family transcriptional regulator [Allosphingosinicella sp.]|jgi:LuxR family quorum-sensing system transcriptional regulator CciR